MSKHALFLVVDMFGFCIIEKYLPPGFSQPIARPLIGPASFPAIMDHWRQLSKPRDFTQWLAANNLQPLTENYTLPTGTSQLPVILDVYTLEI